MKKTKEAEHEFISRILMGNEDAIRLANELFFVSQVWDDLVDGDDLENPVDPEKINRMMWVALVDIPCNPFYIRFFESLHPIVRASIMDWMAANSIEKNHADPGNLMISYIIRDTLTNILAHMAYLIGGYDWMVQVAPEIRMWTHDEDPCDYMDKFRPTKEMPS
jgi:hypothetical protein